MKQVQSHSSNANNTASYKSTTSHLEAPLPQRFKIYTDSDDTDSDERDRKDWMLVSQKQKRSDDENTSNEELDHTATRIRLQNSLMTGSLPTAHPNGHVVLRPQKNNRGIDDQSLASTPIDGVQTDESKSVSGEVSAESGSTDEEMHDCSEADLFNAALDDLNSYMIVRDANDSRAFRHSLNEGSGLTPEEEALISLSICDEDLAGLCGMGIHYPTGLDDVEDTATGYLADEIHETFAPLEVDAGAIWDGMMRMIQYFVKPTQKSITELKEQAKKTMDEWSPFLSSSKFQVAVALTIVAVFTAAKIMDRSRVRNPMPIVRQLQSKKVNEETLEKVFAALAAHKHPTNAWY